MSQSKIIFGFHAIQSRLRQNAASIQELMLDKARIDARMRDLQQAAKQHGVRLMEVDRQRLDGLAGANARHQGVVARVLESVVGYQDIDDILESDRHEPVLFLVLDGVEDPHNLGACLRVADGMGAHAVIVPKDRAVGINATVRKVACGAAETVPVISVTNLARTLRELKEKGVFVIGTAAEAEQDLPQADLNGPLAIVLGAEGSGLRRLTAEHCDALVKIPMFGTVQSLNVSVASGIALYEIRRQRLLALK